MVAHSLSPSLLLPGPGLWTGRFWRRTSALSAPLPHALWVRAALGKGGLRALLSSSPGMAHLISVANGSSETLTPAMLSVQGTHGVDPSRKVPESFIKHTPPPSLSPDIDKLHGTRCYGWGARRSGRWAQIISDRQAGRAAAVKAGRLRGWSITNQEFAFDGLRGEWAPTGVYGKPGLTSVSVGDAVTLRWVSLYVSRTQQLVKISPYIADTHAHLCCRCFRVAFPHR
jgi:hypothetical protein